jgi:hypothetical protein
MLIGGDAAFRRQLMHTHANRAGYLDMDGCTIGDMLLR